MCHVKRIKGGYFSSAAGKRGAEEGFMLREYDL
jgi:hypothetical protein